MVYHLEKPLASTVRGFPFGISRAAAFHLLQSFLIFLQILLSFLTFCTQMRHKNAPQVHKKKYPSIIYQSRLIGQKMLVKSLKTLEISSDNSVESSLGAPSLSLIN